MDRNLPSGTAVSDEFLLALAAELAGPGTLAIILVGSVADGDPSPYSDIDLAHIVTVPHAGPELRYYYRAGRLIGVATRQLDWYGEVLTRPERALFALASLRIARILIDSDGIFRAFQREVQQFSRASLQPAADIYASTLLMQLTEAVHKILSALFRENRLALFDAASSLVFGLTQAVAVQRGVLVTGSSRYLQQVQEVVGLDSAWTRYHRLAVDTEEPVTPSPPATSVEARAVAALRMYQQTVTLLWASVQPDHGPVVKQAAAQIDAALDHLRSGGTQLLP